MENPNVYDIELCTQTKVCEGTLHWGKILYTFQYIQLDI